MSWQTVKISDVAKQIRGVSYSAGDVIDKPQKGYIGLLRANNITDKGLTFVDLQYVPESKVSNSQVLHKNDILIAASSGSLSIVGKAGKFNGENHCTFGAFCKVIRPSNEIDPNYFANYFQTNVYRKTISSLAAGANINNLRNEHIDDLQIPLPPLPEQKRIAAILDKADELKRKREAAIAKLDQLAQSVFVEMFGDPLNNLMGWPLKSLGDVLNLITYGLTVRPDYVSNGVPLISAREIRYGFVDFKNAPNISIFDFNNLSDKAKPISGDILFSKTGSIGHCALVETNQQLAVSQNAARLNFNKDTVNPIYALSYLRFKSIQALAQRSARGNAVKDLQLGIMKEFPFPLPPLALQEKFANRISKIEKLKADSIEALAKQNNLFTSLQHQAFSGQL